MSAPNAAAALGAPLTQAWRQLMRQFTGTLRRRLGVAMFFCVSFSIMGSAVAAALLAYDRAHERLAYELDMHTSMVASRVETRLNRGRQVVDEIATLVSQAVHTGGTRDDLDHHMRAIAERETEAFGVWFLSAEESFDGQDEFYRGIAPSDSTGSFVTYWRRTADGALVQDTTGAEPTAHEDRAQDYYTLPVAQDRAVLIEPYEDQMEGRPTDTILMSTIARPVKSGTRVLGVAGIDLSMDDMSEFLAQVLLDAQFSAALVSYEGALIGDSKRVDGAGGDEAALRSAAAQSFVAVEAKPWGEAALIKSIPVGIDGISGDWRLLVGVEVAIAHRAATEAALSAALWGGLALCLAGFIAVLMSKRLAAPIVASQRIMHRLAAGEVGVKRIERIAPTGIAEIDDMTDALGVFAEAIEERDRLQRETQARMEENQRLLEQLQEADAATQSAQRRAVEHVNDLLVRFGRGEDLNVALEMSGVPQVDALMDGLKVFAEALDSNRLLQEAMTRELSENRRLVHELQRAQAAIEEGQGVIADALQDAFNKLEQGIALDPADATVGVPQLDGILESLNTFAKLVDERRQLQLSLLQQTDETSARLFELECEFDEKNEGHRLVVSEIRKAMQAVIRGDLTYRIETYFPDEHRGLRMDFNDTSANLQNIMLEISQAARNIYAHARDVAQSSSALAEKTDQAKYGLTITGEALGSISATVHNNISGAGQVRDAVAVAREKGHHGKEILEQTAGAIGRIARMSREISKTIDVIDDIAFQTNLLALNAGVEAARAGEGGRGFAVIAQEVRALSQRAGESANAIKDVIRRSDDEVKSGVKLVDQSGGSITELVAKIEEINALVEAMNSLSDEQTQSLMMVRMAVDELDNLAKQNVLVVNRSRLASEQTYAQVGVLDALVKKFELGDADREDTLSNDNNIRPLGAHSAAGAAETAAELEEAANQGPCAAQIDDDFFNNSAA